MSDKTGIEWTDATWNPVTGCTKVSAGCDHCYAETFAERFRGVPGHHFEQGFDVVVRPERLDIPLHWTKPRRIFVNSMSDLFHEAVLKYDDGHPAPFIARVFARMVAADRHTFQVLTKRPGVMASLLRHPMFKLDVSAELLRLGHPVMSGGMSDADTQWPANIWLGTSVEDDYWGRIRIPQLQRTPGAVRFLSCEPLLGPITPDLAGIDWVIVGGESGPGARPMHPDWARSLRDQCRAAGVPFLFKQWGAWAPVAPSAEDWVEDRWDLRTRHPHVVMHPDGTTDDQALWDFTLPARWQRMGNVGKKAAGRELDGRTWDEYPQAVTA